MKSIFNRAVIGIAMAGAVLAGCSDRNNRVVKEAGAKETVILTPFDREELSDSWYGWESLKYAKTIVLPDLKKVVDRQPIDGSRENTYDFQNGVLILGSINGEIGCGRYQAAVVPIKSLSDEGLARAAEMFKKLQDALPVKSSSPSASPTAKL